MMLPSSITPVVVAGGERMTSVPREEDTADCSAMPFQSRKHPPLGEVPEVQTLAVAPGPYIRDVEAPLVRVRLAELG